MKWHDCKTEPPKVSGRYVLVYKYKPKNELFWDSACYNEPTNTWGECEVFGIVYKERYEPIKWAEANLDEED